MGATTIVESQYSPPYWPGNNPFHPGELAVQEQYGVHESVMSYAPIFVRPYLPDQHRAFYEAQPFLVVAARDDQGYMWSTLLFANNENNNNNNNDSQGGAAAFVVTSPHPTQLLIQARPLPGDALESSFVVGSDVGILGIEFATKRRNRVNGRLIDNSNSNDNNGLLFQVGQSFGNCPQYIKPRRWWWKRNSRDTTTKAASVRSNELSTEQMNKLKRAETIFIATGYRGDGDDPRFGNDVSHRGGPAGFVLVPSSNRILLPDFSGNNQFNSIGNLMMDPSIGVTFPQYGTGGMIQVTGTAKVSFDGAQAAKLYPGAKRIIEVSVQQVVELPEGSMPIQWTDGDDDDEGELTKRKLQVVRKVQESDNVTSFYLRPLPSEDPSLWSFRAGQHLPVMVQLNKEDCDDDPKRSCEELQRTYSLSSGPNRDEYRISVKREDKGVVSQFLHDNVKVGDMLTVYKPAGDFVFSGNAERPLVLLSAGVGVTPILSILHQVVRQMGESKSSKGQQRVFWIHGARNGKQHPFREEVTELKKLAGDKLVTHVVYSQPDDDDTDYDSVGHVSTSLLQQLVPDLQKAEVYMCGTGAFMANMESGLGQVGVDPNNIQFETF